MIIFKNQQFEARGEVPKLQDATNVVPEIVQLQELTDELMTMMVGTDEFDDNIDNDMMMMATTTIMMTMFLRKMKTKKAKIKT
jgi:hypothetical protein